jgi:hypothetical protein
MKLYKFIKFYYFKVFHLQSTLSGKELANRDTHTILSIVVAELD